MKKKQLALSFEDFHRNAFVILLYLYDDRQTDRHRDCRNYSSTYIHQGYYRHNINRSK